MSHLLELKVARLQLENDQLMKQMALVGDYFRGLPPAYSFTPGPVTNMEPTISAAAQTTKKRSPAPGIFAPNFNPDGHLFELWVKRASGGWSIAAEALPWGLARKCLQGLLKAVCEGIWEEGRLRDAEIRIAPVCERTGTRSAAELVAHGLRAGQDLAMEFEVKEIERIGMDIKRTVRWSGC